MVVKKKGSQMMVRGKIRLWSASNKVQDNVLETIIHEYFIVKYESHVIVK